MSKEGTWPVIDKLWDDSIVPTLSKYIEIPNQSPAYDPQWATNGLIDKAADLLLNWALAQGVNGLKGEIVKLPEKTPVILLEVPATDSACTETILMYGHLDKQPPMQGWLEGLGPHTPVVRDGKLYGRGGADDGYAIFASVAAIKALQAQGAPHARIVVLIEGSEESGSIHLPPYIEALAPRIGVPSLVICLDSGSGNYSQFWVTTTLRGLVVGDLKVQILREGIHSGTGSGIVPSSFRIIRQLLDRIEDSQTGEIKVAALHTPVPDHRVTQIKKCAAVLDQEVVKELPLVAGARTVSSDIYQLIVNRTWKPALSVTGVDGIPPTTNAGNVLRTHTTLTLSCRLPPTVDPVPAAAALEAELTRDAPYGAKVTFTVSKRSPGWESPAIAPWLQEALDKASKTYFGDQANYIGEGGSIPFMGMLGKRFPKAQFVITGVLGPESNAHGPNEFLHIEYAKKVTAATASIILSHFHAKH